MRNNPKRHIVDTQQRIARQGRYDGHLGLYHDYHDRRKAPPSIVSYRALACLVGAVLCGIVLALSFFF